jgi:Putative polyhydroxyalkanoic acid system protein (PHA_gran_rgn)
MALSKRPQVPSWYPHATQPEPVGAPAPDRFRSHRLGREEATRRLISRLETARTKLGQFCTVEEETWADNRLQFRVRALSQAANGTVDVAEDHARLEVTLPWPLAQIAEKLQRAIQSQGTAMLEKK